MGTIQIGFSRGYVSVYFFGDHAKISFVGWGEGVCTKQERANQKGKFSGMYAPDPYSRWGHGGI